MYSPPGGPVVAGDEKVHKAQAGGAPRHALPPLA